MEATEVLHLHPPEDWPVPSILDESARYLSYLPHSGFHNQRIALTNAFVLSTLLNRTLLVPPITIDIYESSETTSQLDKAPKFSNRIDLVDLRALDGVKLLEFGSLFSVARLVLSREDSFHLYSRTEKLMVFNEPILDAASDAIAQRLGGRDSYIAVHLRIGDGFSVAS
ncbi:hypothetical protein RQP46_005191 [Phenoliferia psychrophenolica]